jgi:hypothetical protein
LGPVQLPDRRLSEALTARSYLHDAGALVHRDLQRYADGAVFRYRDHQPSARRAATKPIGYASRTESRALVHQPHVRRQPAAAPAAHEGDEAVGGNVEMIVPRAEALELEANGQ